MATAITPAPMPPQGANVLPVKGKDRPVRIELTAREIFVMPRTGPPLFQCRRTVECAAEIADALAAQRCTLEAEALRLEATRWKW